MTDLWSVISIIHKHFSLARDAYAPELISIGKVTTSVRQFLRHFEKKPAEKLPLTNFLSGVPSRRVKLLIKIPRIDIDENKNEFWFFIISFTTIKK